MAKADTAKGKRPAQEAGTSLADLEVRNIEIFRGHLRGLLPSTLAVTWGLAESTIKEIIKQKRAEVKPLTREDATMAVQDYIMRIEAMVDELAAAGAGMEGTARVSAINARLNAMRELRETLQSTGILPSDLREMKAELTASAAAQSVVKVLIDNDVDEHVIKQILEAVSPKQIHAMEDDPEIIDADVVDDD